MLHAPRIAAGCMVEQIGFFEQLLIDLTIRMPPQPAQEREPSRRRPWHQGPGDADCRWNLFSMIFANWLATTSAMSGESPIHSSRRLVPGSRHCASLPEVIPNEICMNPGAFLDIHPCPVAEAILDE